MKRVLLIALLFAAAESRAQQKMEYDFPKEMAAPVKVEYVKFCDKGRALYAITCAKCHSTYARRKEIIPDFTQEQLKGYEMRVMNQQHEASMPDELVTAEELSLISTFLIYKKRNPPIAAAKRK
ncbi:hypothetical protein [Polluticoccus soli]|uniref:hypothetical protein n=1 Tax=Polluticoccus soli TaxID=3034150 RepID=UPI0023E31C9C|nr:hypothetical protein [Flavipsychrobacter sp. JY13-12]